MTFDQILELTKILSPILVSLFGFGVLYKLMKEKLSIYQEREQIFQKNLNELEKISNAKIELWQTKVKELSKELAKRVNDEISHKELQIGIPLNILDNKESKNILINYLKFFNIIDESNNIDLFDFDSKTLLILHMYFYGTKQYDKSLVYLDKAIEKEPYNATFLSYKAGTLKKIGKLDDALLFCDKVLKFDKNNADAYYNKACIFALRGEIDKASQNLLMAIRINKLYKNHAENSGYFRSYNLDQLLKEQTDSMPNNN